jgi:hypothetical protein
MQQLNAWPSTLSTNLIASEAAKTRSSTVPLDNGEQGPVDYGLNDSKQIFDLHALRGIWPTA